MSRGCPAAGWSTIWLLNDAPEGGYTGSPVISIKLLPTGSGRGESGQSSHSDVGGSPF